MKNLGSMMVHATALMIGERGLLLRGPSGSGKSSLALRLIQRARSDGYFARLIGDDRVELQHCSDRLIARPHPAIAGALEVHGLGILRAPHEPAGVIVLVVDLLPATQSPERLPALGEESVRLLSVALPLLTQSTADAAVVEKILLFYHSLKASHGVSSLFA